MKRLRNIHNHTTPPSVLYTYTILSTGATHRMYTSPEGWMEKLDELRVDYDPMDILWSHDVEVKWHLG